MHEITLQRHLKNWMIMPTVSHICKVGTRIEVRKSMRRSVRFVSCYTAIAQCMDEIGGGL
jgi:hypothetical protein